RYSTSHGLMWTKLAAGSRRRVNLAWKHRGLQQFAGESFSWSGPRFAALATLLLRLRARQRLRLQPSAPPSNGRCAPAVRKPQPATAETSPHRARVAE